MSRLDHFVTAAAVTLSVGLWAERAVAQPAADIKPVSRAAVNSPGSIQGVVQDERGMPLEGAVVSALGSTMAFAVTDDQGRFTLKALPPGGYVVRAHREGFLASRRTMVEVRPAARALSSLRLSRDTTVAATSGVASTILAAGVGLAPAAPAQPAAGEPDGVEEERASGGDEHTEGVWHLRRLKRSVLKSATAGTLVEQEPLDSESIWVVGRALESARLAGSLLADLPWSGQVNFLTSSSFDSPADLFTNDRLPRGIAYFSLSTAAGDDADVRFDGAMTRGDVASWIVAGSYRGTALERHVVDLGMSYSTQRYDGGNPAALAALSDGVRNVGRVSAADEWAVADRLALEYAVNYAWYDYLERSGLWSSRLGITLRPNARTQMTALVSQQMLAPGAEEFLPSGTGTWLPPERTFSPLASELRAERARHLEVGVERDVRKVGTVGVRHFRQGVDDQLVTVFGASGADARLDLGHYYVARLGAGDSAGWGLRFRREVADRVDAVVDYSVVHARWLSAPRDVALLAVHAPSALRTQDERFHDVTASITTDIPETSTRVLLVYKVNTAFARDVAGSTAPGASARFDLRINQRLPFFSMKSTEWEALLGVRNLFREPSEGGSVYDELLVVRPPKRVVGGLLIRF